MLCAMIEWCMCVRELLDISYSLHISTKEGKCLCLTKLILSGMHKTFLFVWCVNFLIMKLRLKIKQHIDRKIHFVTILVLLHEVSMNGSICRLYMHM